MIQKIIIIIFSLFSLLFSRFSTKEISLSDHFSSKLKVETHTLGNKILTFATSDTEVCLPKEDPYDEKASPLIIIKDEKSGKVISTYSVDMHARFPIDNGMYDELSKGNEVSLTSTKLHNIDDDPEKEVTASWFSSGCGSGGIGGLVVFDLQKDEVKLLGGYPLLDEKDGSKVILREAKTNQELAFPVLHTYDTLKEWKDLNGDGKDELLIAKYLDDPAVEECHLCAHRWELSVYEWKDGKFVPAEEWRSGHPYQTMQKFGWKFDEFIPTYEFFTKKQNAPTVASHFEKGGKSGYIHPVYNYSFLYPLDWKVREPIEGSMYDHIVVEPIWDTSITDGGIQITLSAPISSPLSTKDYLAQWLKEGEEQLDKPVTWHEVLNGREWYFFHDVETDEPYAALQAFTTHKGYLYHLSINPDPMVKQDWAPYESSRSQTLAAFRQVVASFKPETNEKKKVELTNDPMPTSFVSPTDPNTQLVINDVRMRENEVFLITPLETKFIATVVNPSIVQWSPDGKYVAFTDHILSNEEQTYIISVPSGYMHRTLAAQAYLKMQKNPESFDHLYVHNVKWLNNESLQVKVVGHSDTYQGQSQLFTVEASTGMVWEK